MPAAEIAALGAETAGRREGALQQQLAGRRVDAPSTQEQIHGLAHQVSHRPAVARCQRAQRTGLFLGKLNLGSNHGYIMIADMPL